MLQSKSNWRYFEADDAFIDNATEGSMSISPVVKELLLQRGITSAKEAEEFLNPQISYLHNPLLLQSMDRAVERIQTAIKQQEYVLVFGDYDADGVTSTTLLLKALKEIGANCDFYIPNRFTEGYGPNEDAFRWAHEAGFSLIITVDSGIASINEAKLAKELGMDLIISDHHEIQEEVPDAYAIIHPKYSPEYPFKELAGVGVAFKLAEQLLGYFPEHLLDLVAIGTVADMVPLVDENRVLTFYGLKQLTKTNRPGLLALKKQCEIDGNVTEDDIGFLIGPRLNAVGRLQDADLAVELLLTENMEEANTLAKTVEQINTKRKKIVSEIVKEAEEMVNTSEQHVIIVAKEGWNEGVLGIVASRLVKKFNRPSIVLSIKHDQGIAKGSARSIQAFDIFKNGMKVNELFNHFGGHSQAAGMSLPIENIDKLQERFNYLIKEQLEPEDYKQVFEVNKHLHIPEINEELVNEINQLAPFGMENPKPIFHIKHQANSIHQLGKLKNHLKLQFKHESHLLEAIGFGMGELYAHISKKAPISIIGELGINEWNGVRKAQIMMKDLKIDEWQLFDHRGKKNVNLQPYFELDQHHVIVSENELDTSYLTYCNVEQVSYHSNFKEMKKADALYLFELPPSLNHLKELIYILHPKNIHLCFQLEKSIYLTSFPTREDFKWLYVQLWKRKTIDLKNEISMIMDTKGWTKDNIIFMSKVFLELEFVKINDGVMTLHPAPQKNDLDVSTLYKDRINKADVEKKLYYSTIDEIYRLFSSFMSFETAEEEVVNGL
ncbi:MAG TPA: single-stranded-DNA-specific exonuclease RecJ [Candidatus Avamphibacillus sp.]|nr:single-stranded-DNA-specific exonuclease RecJ [Candidatus Avamphibacillus sp.]